MGILYSAGTRNRFRPHKVCILLFRVTSQVHLAMSVCPYERRDLVNYKSWNVGTWHADLWAFLKDFLVKIMPNIIEIGPAINKL